MIDHSRIEKKVTKKNENLIVNPSLLNKKAVCGISRCEWFVFGHSNKTNAQIYLYVCRISFYRIVSVHMQIRANLYQCLRLKKGELDVTEDYLAAG